MGVERRLDEIARCLALAAIGTAAADRNGRAGLACDIDIAQHLLDMARMDQRADLGRGIERMADLDLLDALGGALGELVVDRGLDQRAARRGAALAVQRVDHEQAGIERAVDIGIGEHDHRIFAAEFEMHALQRRRALPHDRGAGGAFADKADRLDVGMLGQCLAGVFAKTVHDIEHARGQSGVQTDFRQQLRGEGRPFRRLVHDRAAGRERRRDLPGRQHERRVPGRDHAHGSDRLTDRVIEMRLGRQRQAVIRLRRAVGIEAEILRAAQRRFRHVADRLPGIHALDVGDLVGTRDDRIRDLVQDGTALVARRVTPAGAERLHRGLRGAVDFGGAAARDIRNRRVVDRGRGLEGFTAAGIGLAVDQMRHDVLAEAREVLFGKRDGVVESGHWCLLLSLPRLRGRAAER